jgi:hypothetical protein
MREYQVEFFMEETGQMHKEIRKAIDWREVASYCFQLQHTLRERHGGNWKFLKLQMVG